MTEQIKKWSGKFGKEYTDRNNLNLEQLDEMYIKQFGISRTKINEEFLSNLDKKLKILEVGCNVGNQLRLLQKMGFENVWGIEISDYALEIARGQVKGANLVKGSALDIPFKDNFFDLVFTSGVLIHIHPKDLSKVIDEIHRVSNRYIYGFEYFSDECQEVEYRGNKELLWKTNFKKEFVDRYDNLKLIKERKFKYKDSDNFDEAYLLEKVNSD